MTLAGVSIITASLTASFAFRNQDKITTIPKDVLGYIFSFVMRFGDLRALELVSKKFQQVVVTKINLRVHHELRKFLTDMQTAIQSLNQEVIKKNLGEIRQSLKENFPQPSSLHQLNQHMNPISNKIFDEITQLDKSAIKDIASIHLPHLNENYLLTTSCYERACNEPDAMQANSLLQGVENCLYYDDIPSAIALTTRIQEPVSQVLGFQFISNALMDSGDIFGAIEILKFAPSSYPSILLPNLASLLVQAGNIFGAIEAVYAITDKQVQQETFVTITEEAKEAGNEPGAIQIKHAIRVRT